MNISTIWFIFVVHYNTNKAMEKALEARGTEVCNEIYRFMYEKHISGKDLAKAMDVTPQSVSNLLRKGKLFSPEVARRWVDGFGSLGYVVNLPFLLSGEGSISDDAESVRYYIKWLYEEDQKPIENTSAANMTFEQKKACLNMELLKKKNAFLMDENSSLKAENKALKRKLAAIKKLLGSE